MQKNLNNGNHVPHPRCSMADECLQKALAERERLLARRPHLRTYQAEIDRLLDQSGNRQGRMAVLATLMQGKLLDMQHELYKLNRILQQTVNSQ